MSTSVPPLRRRVIHDLPPNPQGKYVLAWMTSQRRVEWNYAIQAAVAYANQLGKPLVVFEALRAGYRWASDRLHAFVIEGMLDNAARCRSAGVTYVPYLERTAGDGAGVLARLAREAAVVVGDDYPAFFLPALLRRAQREIAVRFEVIDSNGIVPMRAADRVFARAFDFRRWLQKNLRAYLDERPLAEPLKKLKHREPFALTVKLDSVALPEKLDRAYLSQFQIDHVVGPGRVTGGATSARRRLKTFLQWRLARYGEERSDPDADVAGGFSPYLHFGHLSVHEIFAEVTASEDWNVSQLSDSTSGSSEGWWGLSPSAESFLDELITWRELGFNFCAHRSDYDRYESLPDWAQRTLEKHRGDRRAYTYDLAAFAAGETHDRVWNAAQRELVRDGAMQNYLRMLWGKKILEWTSEPREALRVMIELNNKYALDGRDPNSYSGIFWVLGRYDRAWGPERPIFGTIRYMSSESTLRKLKMKSYLAKYER